VNIEYKTRKGECLTPCPFGQETPFAAIGGKIIMVGSYVCDSCEYHKGKEKTEKAE